MTLIKKINVLLLCHSRLTYSCGMLLAPIISAYTGMKNSKYKCKKESL